MQEHQQQSASHSFRSLHSSSSPHEDGELPHASGSQSEARHRTLSSHESRSEDATLNDDTDETATQTQAPGSDEYKDAQNLVRTFTDPSTSHHDSTTEAATTNNAEARSSDDNGTDTPNADKQLTDVEYVPAPKEYKPSVFSALVKSRLNALQSSNSAGESKQSNESANLPSPVTATSKKGLYEHLQLAKSATKGFLPASSSSLPDASDTSMTNVPTANDDDDDDLEKGTRHQQSTVSQESDDQNNVVAEVADILARRRLLIQLCISLMKYGAPTHRLEDYLKSASRALEIDATFVYIPGTMTCTFRDETLHTNSVETIRGSEALDFSRLKDTFDVYKKVIHEPPQAAERKLELDSIEHRPDQYSVWFRIFLFGLSSVIVGPFSFKARPIDFIPVFFLACALGFLQLKVVPRSDHFSNVFAVSASVVAAFAARGLGSIRVNGDYFFCFSAVAQSTIALILPGFMILNSALELQGQSMVAGSVRMVYAVIYILFLGFGLLLGMTLYGLMDKQAVTTTTCTIPWWFTGTGPRLLYTNFIWVPLFACSLALVYRARWSQLPVMAFTSVCGYQAYYWMSTVLQSNPQIANAIGAFTIGCIANLYSRILKGPAATTMLPAIYCLVPGGLASSGSLVAGVQSSEDIVHSSGDSGSSYSNTLFDVGSNAILICIGTSVGLYLSALVVYPFGKKRSGLFSFS